MINRDDFLTIYGWMNELFKPKQKKRGATLDRDKRDAFAYIWSYSRDGHSVWYGQQQTLAELIGCSESVLCRKLKEMVNDGYIIKEEVSSYGMFHHYNYRVSPKYLAMHSNNTTVDSETIAIASETTAAIDSEATKYSTDSNNTINNTDITEDKSSVPSTKILEKDTDKVEPLTKQDYIFGNVLKHIDTLGLSETLTKNVKDWVEMVYGVKKTTLGIKQVDNNLGLIGIYPEEIQNQLVSDAILKCHNTFKYVIDDYEKQKRGNNTGQRKVPYSDSKLKKRGEIK